MEFIILIVLIGMIIAGLIWINTSIFEIKTKMDYICIDMSHLANAQKVIPENKKIIKKNKVVCLSDAEIYKREMERTEND